MIINKISTVEMSRSIEHFEPYKVRDIPVVSGLIMEKYVFSGIFENQKSY